MCQHEIITRRHPFALAANEYTQNAYAHVPHGASGRRLLGGFRRPCDHTMDTPDSKNVPTGLFEEVVEEFSELAGVFLCELVQHPRTLKRGPSHPLIQELDLTIGARKRSDFVTPRGCRCSACSTLSCAPTCTSVPVAAWRPSYRQMRRRQTNMRPSRATLAEHRSHHAPVRYSSLNGWTMATTRRSIALPQSHLGGASSATGCVSLCNASVRPRTVAGGSHGWTASPLQHRGAGRQPSASCGGAAFDSAFVRASARALGDW